MTTRTVLEGKGVSKDTKQQPQMSRLGGRNVKSYMWTEVYAPPVTLAVQWLHAPVMGFGHPPRQEATTLT